ncbi:MAG: ATP-binding cassette domain-containing protein [Anaerolineae bacterium]
MNERPALQVQDLHKRFGDIHAVQGISFEVQAGQIFSLLGPNGAGKSTTISILSCLLQPTSGDALVMGHLVRREPMAVKAAIGVVPQEIALYEDLSARENLDFWGKMYGLRGAALRQRVDEVLDTIGLTDRQKGRVAKFSGGMKRRLNIGIALLHRPQVIIMDEPTVGIDPQTRRSILDSVKELNQQGMTVLITGQAFQVIGHLLPTAWAMDGFENLVIRGLGIESVLRPVTIMSVYAVGLFTLAVWRFRFE